MANTVHGYEGWENQETWSVMLTMNNDQNLYRAYIKHFKGKELFNVNDVKGYVRRAIGKSLQIDWSLVNWDEILEDIQDTMNDHE